jgi:hypothetical protein
VHTTVPQKRKKKEKKTMSFNHTATISVSYTTGGTEKNKARGYVLTPVFDLFT